MLKKIFNLSILILFLSEKYFAFNDNNITLRIVDNQSPSGYVEKDLVEFIEELKLNSSKVLESAQVKEKAIMIVGLTGSGKSTLVNYINGVPLVCKYNKADMKWVVDLSHKNNSLPGGFTIGHKVSSETLYPASYSPNGKDYSFVDNPGFRDTRGISVEIANAFFREQITHNVTFVKFLLLIAHKDLEDRGQKFRDSIKGFSDFLGIFDEEDTRNLSKSVAIIITRVENEHYSDDEMKDFFKAKLIEIIEDETRSNNFKNKNEETVFRQLISDNQIEIFSNPKKEQLLDDAQRKRILLLIERLDYIKKNDLKLRVTIDKNYFEAFYLYVEKRFNIFKSFFEETIVKSNIDYYDKEKTKIDNPKDAIQIYNNLNEILTNSLQIKEFEVLLESINKDIINETLKQRLLYKKKIVSFLADLASENHLGSLTFERQWINVNINSQLETLINDLIDNLQNRFVNFVNIVQKTIEKSILDYFYQKISEADDAKKASVIYIQMNNILINEAQINELTFLLKNFDQNILDVNVTDDFLNKKKDFEAFITILPFSKYKDFNFTRQWLSSDFNAKITNLLDKLIQFLDEQVKQFLRIIEKKLSNFVFTYFKKEIQNAVFIADVKIVEKFLIEFQSNVSQPNNLESFIKKIKYVSLDKDEKDKIFFRKNILYSFISILPDDKKANFYSQEIRLSQSFYSNLNELINEAKQYYNQREEIFKNGIFTYKGYFGKMSLILPKINSNLSIVDLKSVRIFTTHSFLFDIDYKIDKERYRNHSSSLVIISPKIIVEKSIIVDLSCDRIPGYPDNKEKASDGYSFGDKGMNGKPGLPGFNGGDLILLFDSLKNPNNLKFISVGGKGGPGQNGGDGKEGFKGKDALYSEVDCGAIDFFPSQQCFKDSYYLGVEKLSLSKQIHYFARDGSKGGPGGDSGRPGIGGLGGFSGKSNLINKNWVNITYKDEFRYGDNGKPGKEGLGGLSGDTAIRGWLIDDPDFIVYPSILVGSIIRAIIKKSEFLKELDQMKPSHFRAKNGSLNNQFVIIGKIEPKKRELDVYEIETDYLKYLTEIDFEFKNTHLIDGHFSKWIIGKAYSEPVILNLIERFEILSSSKFVHLLPILQNQISECIKNKNTSDEERIVLSYISASISSTIFRSKASKKTTLVVNIKNYLEFTNDRVTNLENLAKQKVIDVYRNDYENNLKKKIENANSFINLLKNDIENNEKEINIKIKDGLKQIENLKRQVHSNDKQLIDEKSSLEEALALKLFFSSAKIGCMFLSFLGPKGALIGSILRIALEIGSSALTTSESEKMHLETSDIDNLITDYQAFEKNKNNGLLKKLEHDLSVLEIKNKIENGFKSHDFKSQHLQDSIESRIDKLPDSVEKYEIEQKYFEYLKLNKHGSNETFRFKFTKNKLNETKPKDSVSSTKKKSGASINIAKLVVDLFTQTKVSQHEIEILNDAINKNANRFKILNEIKKKLEEIYYELLKEIQTDSSFITNIFKGDSLSVFDFDKWHVKKHLDYFKYEMSSLFKNFESNKEISHVLHRIENALTTVIEINDHIEKLKQHSEFANFLTKIAQTELSIGVPVTYQEKINNMKMIINGNILIEMFENCIEAFKYWSFPLFCENTQDMIIKDIDPKIDNIYHAIYKYKGTIEMLLEKIKNSESSIDTSIDNHIQSFNFENDNSFYEWSSSDYPFEIRQLLNGNLTTLYADVNHAKFDAIKFCTLYITIEIKASESANKTLNNILKDFYVELKHSGISNYKFKNTNYKISLNSNYNEKLMLKYEYGNPKTENANESFKKLANNKPLLSPYTFWEIMIYPIKFNNRNNPLKQLALFLDKNKYEIFVSLQGRGQYVSDAIDNISAKCRMEKNNDKYLLI